MIIVSGTVKDSFENITSFVEMNLQAGADMVFIFLDAPHQEVKAKYKESKNVVVFNSYGSYWQVNRPKNLNVRQKININIANFMLDALGVEGIVFHLDSDEVLYLETDKKEIEKKEYVLLEPLELMPEVAEHDRMSGSLFKRKLSQEKLDLLYSLGEIDHPSNRSFFNGHLAGKCGVSPNVLCTIGIHTAKYDSYKKPDLSQQGFILHYDNPTLEGFLNKWMAEKYEDGKSHANIREERKRFFSSVSLIAKNKSLSKSRKNEILSFLYEKKYVKPGKAAGELGYLKRVSLKDISRRDAQVTLNKDSLFSIFNYFDGKDKTIFSKHMPLERTKLLNCFK